MVTSEPCRLCRSTGSMLVHAQVHDYITKQVFDVRRCSFCGVAFTYPQPTSIHRFYPPHYRRYGSVVHALLRLLYELRARAWVRRFKSTGLALEIGCGDGWMLRALRNQGWKVVGNERTVQSTMFASTVNGLPVFVGGLEALKRENCFDLIILFQVLEHLADPLKTLKQCAKLLKPDGTLVVAVPNMESWQSRLTGPFWFHLDVPRHLFHFSSRSLSYALGLAGFDVVGTRFVSIEHDPYGWVQSFLNLVGFQRNLLTKHLMGEATTGIASRLTGIVMYILSACLLTPSVLLAASSWAARSGALVESRAQKSRRQWDSHVDGGENLMGQPSQFFYDDIWKSWKDMQQFAPAPRYIRRMVMKELRRLEFRSVFDVGCGEGALLRMIKEAYPQVELAGSDLSETALASCRNQFPNGKIFRLDIEKDDVATFSYDLVISVQVLEHLNDDIMALKKLAAMSRKYVLINVPGGKLDEHAKTVGHYRHYTKRLLVKRMEQAGIRVIRVFACGWPFQSLVYRQLVRRLPRRTVERIGLGAYSPFKKKLMQIAEWLYLLNLSFIGTEIFAIGIPEDCAVPEASLKESKSR